MAVSMTEILRVLPSIAGMLLPGMAGASKVGNLARVALPNNLKGGAFDYPDLTKDFRYPMTGYDVTTSKDGKTAKLPALNQGINRGNQNAALMQDLTEHNRAVANGTEKDLERWWPGEDTEPRRTISPQSSAIEGIRINKNGTVQVKWYKGSKWYTYKAGKDIRESSEMAKDLLTAPSIGRALPRKGKYAHKDSKDLTGPKVADHNIGWWGRKYYNANWAEA